MFLLSAGFTLGVIETVLRIKQLLYGEGLTLAGVRRKLTEEQPAAAAVADPTLSDLAELFGSDARERLLEVKRGLRELSAMLSRAPGAPLEEFHLRVAAPPKVKPSKEKPKSKKR